MILYVSEFCPFCHSCRLVLEAKKLSYEPVKLDLSKKKEFPEKLSPYRHVPVLLHRGETIFESAIINEYLDEAFPDINLLTVEPSTRARIRFWVDFVHDRLVPAYFSLMNASDSTQWKALSEKLAGWFRFVEARAFHHGWISGQNVSLADFALYPWVERFVSAERYRGGFIPEDCRKLALWIGAMELRPEVKKCAKSRREYVDFFDQYWTPILPSG